jgi:hypothetical protein
MGWEHTISCCVICRKNRSTHSTCSLQGTREKGSSPYHPMGDSRVLAGVARPIPLSLLSSRRHRPPACGTGGPPWSLKIGSRLHPSSPLLPPKAPLNFLSLILLFFLGNWRGLGPYRGYIKKTQDLGLLGRSVVSASGLHVPSLPHLSLPRWHLRPLAAGDQIGAT